MTDGTRSDASAGTGTPGEVAPSAAMAVERQWAAEPTTDAAPVVTPDGGERDGPEVVAIVGN